MILFYNIVLFLLCIPAALILAVRYRKRASAGMRAGLAERLGRWRLPHDLGSVRPVLWIHGASLGEVRAVEPLVAELGEYDVVLTTLTQAGCDYARSNGLAKAVFLAPLDFSCVVDRVFALVRPAGLILVETELWPGMLRAAKKHGSKVLIINARLSGASFSYYRITRLFWKHILGYVDRCAARAPEDGERFARLGVPNDRITVTGNIKYDREFLVPQMTKEAAGFRNTDMLWVAGSTREREEAVIAGVFKRLKVRFPQLKLAIAPRHLNRVGEIGRILSGKGITFALRSSSSTAAFDCLLIDTFGELMKYYALADVAFVGGSLVDKGGQNPIEPAACSKPVIFGPYMDNFLSESRVLRENGGGIAVSGADELYVNIEKMLMNEEYRTLTGAKARQAVELQKGSLMRTAGIIRLMVPGIKEPAAGMPARNIR